MEYDKEKKEIKLNRKLNVLDKFVLDFIRVLEKYTDYVIISGYVSILLGRSRSTEDIDLLVPKMNKKDFKELWEEIHKKGFECVNTPEIEEAFGMLREYAIRFFKKIPIPNIEFKIIKNDLDEYSFNNKIRVNLKEGSIYISPLEMQIAYKLFLGSQKDIEDAKHLYELFKEKLNKEELAYLINKLRVKDKFELIDKFGKNENRFRRIK